MQDEDVAHGSEGTMMAQSTDGHDRFADLHPDLQFIAPHLPDYALSHESLPGVRAMIDEHAAQALEPDDAVRWEQVMVPGRDGGPDVRVLVFRPVDQAPGAPVILGFHGGGFLFGTAETSARSSIDWARDTGCTVISIDYRISPEHPYPAPIEDGWAVLLWAAENAQAQGWDAGRILLKGDSAGGGLAAGVALLARDRGGPPIAGQVLIYPMIDDRTRQDHAAGQRDALVWPCVSNQFAWSCYLAGVAGGDVPVYAAPARAQDLRGLPPTFIGTATLDLFYRENMDYAQRLAEAEVPVVTFVVDGGFHGFDSMAPDAAVSRRFTAIAKASAAFMLAL